jgi:ABC-type multidrug transport system, ATPase and permease components
MYALNKFATFTSFNITKNLFDNFMKRNYYFFVENHSSNLITVLHHHISAFTGSVLYPILEMSSKFLILFAIIFYLFLTNPISTLFTLILLLSAFVFAFMYSKKIFRNLGKQNVLTDNYINKLIIEILTSIKFIKIMNLEKNFSNQYINYIYQQCLIRMKLFRLTILPKFMIEFIGIFGILSLTIYLTTSKGLMESLPILAVFLLAGFKILPAINTFYANSSRIISSLTSIDIIYDYFLK